MAIQDTLMNLPDEAFQGPLEKYKQDYKDARYALLTGRSSDNKKIAEVQAKVQELSQWYEKNLKPIVDAVATYMKYKAAALAIAKALEKANEFLSADATVGGSVFKAVAWVQRETKEGIVFLNDQLGKVLEWANIFEGWIADQVKIILDAFKELMKWLNDMKNRLLGRTKKMAAAANAKVGEIYVDYELGKDEDFYKDEEGEWQIRMDETEVEPDEGSETDEGGETDDSGDEGDDYEGDDTGG